MIGLSRGRQGPNPLGDPVGRMPDSAATKPSDAAEQPVSTSGLHSGPPGHRAVSLADGSGQRDFAPIPGHHDAEHGRQGQNADDTQPGNCGQRDASAGEQFRHVEDRKAGAAEPGPAHLTIPDVAQRAVAEGLNEGPGDQPNLQIGLADDLGRGRVLGRLGGQRGNPAGPIEDVRPL